MDKIPCFVGGKGLLVASENERLFGKIYPVTKKAKVRFFWQDWQTQSAITINNPNWEDIRVMDITVNTEVNFTKVNHDFEFEIVEGYNYQVN